MRRNGNVASNRVYNPRNQKPAIPLDVDEVDAALERFIRQKYDQQTFSGGSAVRPAARQDTGTSGSTRSSDDQPPPLPPKPGKRFGFSLRSASSALPLTRHSHVSPPTSPDTANGYYPSPPIRVNKQSRVFGASVGGGGENMEAKLASLTDMGFTDERRNTTILKGLNGNLERTIETLVRLGDGNAPASRSRSPAKPKQAAVSQPFSRVGVEPPPVASGITISPSTEPKSFDPEVPQPAYKTSGSEPKPPETRSYNPFEAPHSRSDARPLEKGFEYLQISQPQPLFPNATGGYPIQPEHIQASRFQQSMTPPVPQLHQYIHPNPYAQQMPNPNGNFNPFFQAAQQAAPLPTNSYMPGNQPQANSNTYNPFMAAQQPSHPYANENVRQPPENLAPQQIPEQQQLLMASQGQLGNPFQSQQPSDFQPSSQYRQVTAANPYLPQPIQAQPTGRFDKSSILALYNYPQLAPPPPPEASTSLEDQVPSAGTSTIMKLPGQRSVTMPAQLAAGSRNPFLTTQTNNAAVSSNAVSTPPSGLSRHVSQESVDVGSYQNGRHSPDAFASLSARSAR